MSLYRKINPLSSHHPSTPDGKLERKEASRYKLKFYGSFFALVFFLAIIYGRSKQYKISEQSPVKEKIDYSSQGWRNRFNKLPDFTRAIDLSEKDKEIEILILIIKDYRYWEKEVDLARKSGNKKKEEDALSNYRQAMEKIARYSTEAIKKAEEKIEPE